MLGSLGVRRSSGVKFKSERLKDKKEIPLESRDYKIKWFITHFSEAYKYDFEGVLA